MTIRYVDAAARDLERIVPAVTDMKMVDGRATAYVCERYSCNAPVTDVEGLMTLLQQPRETGESPPGLPVRS